MERLVSVIVPTCGTHCYFVTCLEALRKQTHRSLEVIVINNSLSLDLAQKAQKAYPSATVYSPPQNLYYGPALNRGIEMSRGEFVLCLNDDVFLKEDFIEKALRGFSLREDVGMVGGKILRPDQKTIDSTGLFLNMWYGACERGYGRPDRGQFDTEGFIFGVSGAAAFYRRKMLDDIKEEKDWFDPRFRMFFEDLDLSWRARKKGWKAYYIPGAIAYHVRGGSARTDAGEGKTIARRYLSDEFHSGLIKNRYLMVAKNETLLKFLPHLIPSFLYDVYTWGYVVFFRPKVIKIFLRNKEHFRAGGREASYPESISKTTGSVVELAGTNQRKGRSSRRVRGWALPTAQASGDLIKTMSPIKTIFVHKEILLSLTAKNLKSRFVGSALGFLWAFINPLLFALTVSYVFTHIFKTGTKNFSLFIISGMLPWTFFATSLQDAVVSIPANATLLKQFALPREFIPLSSLLTNFVFFLLGLLVVMPFFIAVNDKVLVMLPVLLIALVLQLLFTGGLSLIFSAMYVPFRDISQILNTVLMFWLWLTPVFFSVDMVSPESRIVFELNPMTPFINLYRNALLGINNSGKAFLPAAALALISISVGYAVFYKQKNDFLKRI